MLRRLHLNQLSYIQTVERIMMLIGRNGCKILEFQMKILYPMYITGARQGQLLLGVVAEPLQTPSGGSMRP
ncbi:hypothetical protein Leryth_003917 [Lithospermum erythrorhizon]|nr:hypothetical protein Leryth_003917 [Lithospermum erythrorhizon]